MPMSSKRVSKLLRISLFVGMMSPVLGAVNAAPCAGASFLQDNLIVNGNWIDDNGIGLRKGWSSFTSAFSSLNLTPINGGGLDFVVSGGPYIFYEQKGIRLVPGGRYLLSYEVKTYGLKGARHYIVIRDNPGRKAWTAEQRTADFPEDTTNGWEKVEKQITLLDDPEPTGYRLSIMCANSTSRVERSHFALRKLSLVPVDAETAAKSRPMSEKDLKPLVARIVPIDPLLSDVDAERPSMTFYWPGRPSCNVTNCQLRAMLDGEQCESAFMSNGRARAQWKARRPGKATLTAVVKGPDGETFASNAYPVVVGERVIRRKTGRRLNNFVYELVNMPLSDGVVKFECSESGWIWISFDGDIGSPIGYLDDAGTPSVYRRAGERFVETQRFVSGGGHELRISGARGGRLRIHAVKTITLRLPLILKARPSTTSGGSFRYSLPFAFYTGSISAANTTYLLNFTYPERTKYVDPEFLGIAFERGIDYVAGVKLGVGDPRRDVGSAVESCLMGPLWQLGVPIAVDENSVVETPNRAVNFTEAVWKAVCQHPERRINLYYADSASGYTYDCPEKQVAEISAIINSGSGTGCLVPELYAPVLPSVAGLNDYLGAYAEFVASASRLVPAARGKVALLPASFNLIAHWCTYTTPSTDVKAHTAEMMRTFAVDPRFAESAGISFMGDEAGDEEIRRWGLKCLRYYALEGGTGDLAEKYGYAWTPGLLKNEDFASGLSGWVVEGTVEAERIDGYGKTFQTRRQDRWTRGDVGDAVATFVSRTVSANKLSQRIVGLVPGKYYSAFCCVMERDALMEARPPLKKCNFSIRMKGADEVPELRYELGRSQQGSLKAAGGARRRAHIYVLRYVFKANSPEATLVLADCDDKGAMNAAGARLSVNSVMVKPYYLEPSEDPHDVAAALGWSGDNRLR